MGDEQVLEEPLLPEVGWVPQPFGVRDSREQAVGEFGRLREGALIVEGEPLRSEREGIWMSIWECTLSRVQPWLRSRCALTFVRPSIRQTLLLLCFFKKFSIPCHVMSCQFCYVWCYVVFLHVMLSVVNSEQPRVPYCLVRSHAHRPCEFVDLQFQGK